jgi:DNA repair exonuclease SbcCD ATPase subunit
MSYRITQLKAENVKRLSAVSITPEGNLVVIGGENGAGKSSVLDSIMYALAGKTALPAEPIRQGQKCGRIVVELDGEKKLTVERRLTPSGGTLEVKSADGAKFSSPQAMLDALCGRIAFDPLEFTRQRPEKQAETLRTLVGLDFTEMNRLRQKLYDERTEINKQAKSLAAHIESIRVPDGTPAEEILIAELIEELKQRQQQNADADAKRRDAVEAKVSAQRLKTQIDTLEEKIRQAQIQLSRLKDEFATAVANGERLELEAAKAPAADTTDIEMQIQKADDTNRNVRLLKQRQQLEAEKDRAEVAAEKLTAAIEKLDADKTAAMTAAAWPVPGLGFGEHGITLNGLPFDQASSAEQLRVSVAMGLAMNPQLRILLIRDGSLLDAKSLALVAQMAQASDAQLWVERVGTGAECSVVIEDGHVRSETKDDLADLI